MSLPIFIHGLPCGELSECADGLYTVLSADCEVREGLIRLWAHGGGRSACLGLLAPEDGRLRLTRRLSRRERAALPLPIERVDDRADEAAPEPTKPSVGTDVPEQAKTTAGKDVPEQAKTPAGKDVPEQAKAPKTPAAPAAEEPGWRALPDGTLLGPDGAQAIPASLPPSSPLSPYLRRIHGRDYLVFRP